MIRVNDSGLVAELCGPESMAGVRSQPGSGGAEAISTLERDIALLSGPREAAIVRAGWVAWGGWPADSSAERAAHSRLMAILLGKPAPNRQKLVLAYDELLREIRNVESLTVATCTLLLLTITRDIENISESAVRRISSILLRTASHDESFRPAVLSLASRSSRLLVESPVLTYWPGTPIIGEHIVGRVQQQLNTTLRRVVNKTKAHDGIFLFSDTFDLKPDVRDSNHLSGLLSEASRTALNTVSATRGGLYVVESTAAKPDSQGPPAEEGQPESETWRRSLETLLATSGTNMWVNTQDQYLPFHFGSHATGGRWASNEDDSY
jgi:hypothetical protein